MDQQTDVPGGPVPWVSADDGDPRLVLPNGSSYDFYRPELYTLDGANYESVVVGLLTILQCKHADNPACPGPDGPREFNSVFPAFSRDGFHFTRPAPVRSKTGHSRSSIAPLNLTGCNSSIGCTVWNYEDSQSVGGGFLVVRDKIYLYASGNANMNWPDPTLPVDESQLRQAGLFTLRRDGFASLDRVGPGRASLTTRPLQWDLGQKLLWVNFNGSGLVVRLMAVGSNATLEPWGASRPLTVDSTRAQVHWGTGLDLGRLAGKPVRLRVEWAAGSLFSFWTSATGCGESGGFAAAGGPGLPNAVDTEGSCAHGL